MMGDNDSETEDERRDGVEDMIKLGELNEQSLLRNIRQRYLRQLIYVPAVKKKPGEISFKKVLTLMRAREGLTVIPAFCSELIRTMILVYGQTYTGSILVAVNPYCMFNNYGLDMVKRYEGQVLGAKPPHLFAIGSTSYSKMIKDNENQVIVISGESGAGKTESTKLIMQYLAAVNKSPDNLITEQILEASPLLESFGNAKTTRNDNSSRFGKYVEVYFKGGKIVGAKTSEYLLEKSRIAKQAPEERNYHVFYEMLVGLTTEQKAVLGLTKPPKYYFLNQGESCEIPSKDDRADFYDLKAAMQVLGLTTREQDTIFKILASILHLGNIFFQKTQNAHQHEGVQMGSDAEIKWVSHLLELSQDWLHEALTMKVTEARRERLLTPLSIDQALDARDAIAKALYQRLFTWLVERVNQIVAGDERDRTRATSIALLDIFGFEDFQINSFEQLCINYANETLQFYFNKHVFRLEQAEYARERIDWTVIDFQDNQPTIDLIAKKPHGVIHLLDDESNFPKGTDQSFLEKCHYAHITDPLYSKPRLSGNEFSIHHYAGKVTYSVVNFLDKNRDTLRSDVMEMMIKSRNEILSQMFRDLRDSTLNRTVTRQGFYVTMKPKTPTVAASFHESLVSLVDTMSMCHPWFVRCIKPNNHKAPMEIQTEVVLAQLRYTGMLETIHIRKMGYPVRQRFHAFSNRYYPLLGPVRGKKLMSESEVCGSILHHQGPKWKNAWQIGVTKVFLKESLANHLEIERHRTIEKKVLVLQKFTRGFLARRRYRRVRDSAVFVQAMLRAWMARKRFVKMRDGFIKTQAQVRMVQQRRRYQKMQESRRQRADERARLQNEEAQRRRHDSMLGERSPSRLSKKPSRPNRSRLSMHDRQKTIKPPSRHSHHDLHQSQSSAQVNVAHLEIPTDLAYVISKLDELHCVHMDRNIVNVVSHVDPLTVSHTLPDNIDTFPFNKYVQTYFKEKWRMRREPITSPFLSKARDGDAKDAIAIFKLILRFMNDGNMSGRREKTIADYIVQKGISKESLKDEIFVQLCTQTWLNKNDTNCERGWLLMAHALSCFTPSDNLSKYLLKYVSDQGYNGYKRYCQHKLMDSLILNPPLPRYYPPSLLEWHASKKRQSMALGVSFPDGEKMIGPVESWTTGEEFASHMLELKQLTDSQYGWTAVLRDENNQYELLGYDYVLDLLAEMEVPRGFPYTLAPFLVTTDRGRDASTSHKDLYDGTPHNPELMRLVEMTTSELRDPIPVSPRPAPEPEDFFRSTSHDSFQDESPYATQESLLSPTSRLNNRSMTLVEEPTLSSRSILNVRYTNKRKAPGPPRSPQQGAQPPSPPPPPPLPPPVTANTSENGLKPPESPKTPQPVSPMPSRIGLSPSKLNDRYGQETSPERPASTEPQLAPSKLNERYARSPGSPIMTNGHIPNGGVPYVDSSGLELSNNKMNQRYTRNQPTSPQPHGTRIGARDHIIRRQRSESGHYVADRLERMSNKSSNPTDMDQWVDHVFDDILDPNLDDLSDARTVESRLKGGGRGITGLTTQPGFYQPPTYAPSLINQTVPPIVASGNITSVPTFSPTPTGSMTLGSMVTDPMQILAAQQLAAQQQAAAQQMAQQQALLQAQQTQAALAAQSIQQETSTLQVQLQQASLQNQLLQQNVQGELLKQQLRQLKDQGTEQPTSAAPGASQSRRHAANGATSPSVLSQPRSTSPRRESPPPKSPPVMVREVKRQAPSGPPGDVRSNEKGAHGEIDTSRPGGVKTLKSKYETRHVPPVTPHLFERSNGHSDPESFYFDPERDSKVQFSGDVQQIPSPVSLSPPPAENALSQPLVGTSLVSSPPPAPAPPPPPPVSTTASPPHGDGIAGELKRIRVGSIQWPPPTVKEKKKKEPIPVGRLRIDEKKVGKSPKTPKDAHAAMMEAIQNRGKVDKAEEEPEEPISTGVKIDIESRKRILERQLTASGMLDGKQRRPPPDIPRDPTPPTPPPSPPPKKSQPQPQTQPPKHSGNKAAPAEPLPPAPPVGTPRKPPVEEAPEPTVADLRALEKVQTKLFPAELGPYLTYNRVPWTLEIRKEVFTPTEKLDSPIATSLIFCQIVQDVFSNTCVRIAKEERMRMRSMLENNGITPRSMLGHHKVQIKRQVVDTARDWPYYFARLFPVNGGSRHPSVQVVGVTHSGVRLLAREKDLFEDNFHVIDQFRFEEIIDVSVPKPSALQIHVNNDYVIVYTPRATQIKNMVDAYCIESEKNVMYVKAVKSYLTRDPTLLRFHEGDIIKLTNREMTLAKGWLYGSLHGRTGLFPAEYVIPMARYELDKPEDVGKPVASQSPPHPIIPVIPATIPQQPPDPAPSQNKPPPLAHYTPSPPREEIYSDGSIYSLMPDVQKYSMMEFAMLHFRQSPFRYEMIRSEDTGSIHGTFKMISSLKAKTLQRQQSKKRGSVPNWTWKEQADMVKWTKSPIQASLLKFDSPQINKLALECFIAIMRYMGDYPLGRGQKPVDCVYTLLRACYSHEEVRDEVYCQLAKQTTSNRSTRPESLQQGWRLFSIVTCYFRCTDVLEPYLFKYLEGTAYDNQRPHQALAAQSLQNLRATFKYGGRRNVPSRVEIEALTRGRNTKRQMCVMPGGLPVVLNIRSCSVVQDAIDQICGRLDIHKATEKDEFTIFYVLQSESRYCTLNRSEYIFDITTELANQKKEYYLLFQRTSWVYPLHMDYNPLYIDVMYYQCIPDYHDGYLLPVPTSTLKDYIKSEISLLGALQIRATDSKGTPTQKDVLAVIPKTLHNLSGTNWTTLVEDELKKMQTLTPQRAKIYFLETLSRWPLFGSTFFNVKSVAEQQVKGESLLALNKAGVHFLHPSTHEAELSYPFSELISTRRFHGDKGHLFLDMKVGDLMHQKVTRIETDQGGDISVLIGQYIHILKKARN